MLMPGTGELAATSPLEDEQIVERVRGGEPALYEILMRRYNQRLYRIARGILGSDSEAEDVMQEAYLRAYRYLDQFEGRSRFSTWLTRIAVHEALARARRRGPFENLDDAMETPSLGPTPEQQAANSELRAALQDAIDKLPEKYRSVFILREVEQLDTAEAATCLDLNPQTVKIRLHRARAFLRRELYRASSPAGLYDFHLSRCDRVVAGVFARLSDHLE